MPWETSIRLLDLPEKLQGVRILDVGGGASDLTAELLDRGADAYAVDPRYRSRSDLKGRVRKHIKGLYSTTDRDHMRRSFKTLERFMQSTKTHANRYKSAYASELPFPDDYFDIIFSIDCITVYLDIDSNLLYRATQECIRTVKSGGKVHFFPFGDTANVFGDSDVTTLRLQNQNQLLTSLRVNPIVNVETRKNTGVNYDVWTLMIIKK